MPFNIAPIVELFIVSTELQNVDFIMSRMLIMIFKCIKFERFFDQYQEINNVIL